MIKKSVRKRVCLMIMMLIMGVSLHAQERRAGSVEAFFSPTYIAAKHLEFSSESAVDFNERLGWNFGLGYNINDYFAASMIFTNSNGTYRAQGKDSSGDLKSVTENMYSHTMTAEVTYHLFKGPLTPYLSANIGIAFIDTGVLDESVDYEKHYAYREMSYGAAAGLRYDFENVLYLKGGIGANVVNFNAEDTPLFTIYQLSVGARF